MDLNDFVGPDSKMLEPAWRIAEFMVTRNAGLLDGVFSSTGVTLVDSFAPFVFTGAEGVAMWSQNFTTHVGDHEALRNTLLEPQEFSRDGDVVFYSQPIRWEFAVNSRRRVETGGMALVLIWERAAWRVQHYAWAVTDFVVADD
jgi:hypothetical protein